MPRLPAALALVCLAGCASITSSDVIRTGKHLEYASSLAPVEAAACMARNGQSADARYTSTLRELPAKDTYQVSIDAPGLAKGTVLVVHTAPQSAGSRLEFFISPRTVESDAQDWIEKLRTGC